jgi:hypothetical protein
LLRCFVSKARKRLAEYKKMPIRGKQNWAKTALMIKKGKYRTEGIIRKVLEGQQVQKNQVCGSTSTRCGSGTDAAPELSLGAQA